MENFKSFAAIRIAIGLVLTLTALWVITTLFGLFEKPQPKLLTTERHRQTASDETSGHTNTLDALQPKETDSLHGAKAPPAAVKTAQSDGHPAPDSAAHAPVKTPAKAAVEHAPAKAAPLHGDAAHGSADSVEPAEPKPRGVAFVEAVIQPLDYELNERFWGWRVNDILDFTDNVNNFQLGVLEVTRRASVALLERIARTGSTAAFDQNLEDAVNWLMISGTEYWFPSAETKYDDALAELKIYRKKLEKGIAPFFTRSDNLIPLLASFEDLLGSCDDNLVKTHEQQEQPVSFFKADDYFFYAKGVASAMYTILEAVAVEFGATVESRRGTELLHHAIESCHHAMNIDPWLITNSNWSGILANHRANLAAPISHARFYIGMLIKTLST
jgi:hypothetical protein